MRPMLILLMSSSCAKPLIHGALVVHDECAAEGNPATAARPMRFYLYESNNFGGSL